MINLEYKSIKIILLMKF